MPDLKQKKDFLPRGIPCGNEATKKEPLNSREVTKEEKEMGKPGKGMEKAQRTKGKATLSTKKKGRDNSQRGLAEARASLVMGVGSFKKKWLGVGKMEEPGTPARREI